MRDRRWVESAVDEAIARGDFEDLPGAGKPLDLPDHHDPDWWIKGRLEGEDVDRDALLPPVILLRREREGLEETLRVLRDESAVREYAEDFTARVLEDRAANPFACLLAPVLDPEDAVARWREIQAEEGAAAGGAADPGAGPRDEPGPHDERRGLLARLRRILGSRNGGAAPR